MKRNRPEVRILYGDPDPCSRGEPIAHIVGLAKVQDQGESQVRTRQEGAPLHSRALPGVEGEAVAVLGAGGDREDSNHDFYRFSSVVSLD